MNIIVDTNIVFSAVINSKGVIGDLLFNSPQNFVFISPEFMHSEISRYKQKLIKASKLVEDNFNESMYRVLGQIVLISEEVINPKNWTKAFELTKGIDENDTVFIALTIETNGILWTGDKKLINGVIQKNWQNIKSTNDLLQLRGY